VYRSVFSEMQVEIDRQPIPPLNRQGPFPPFGFSEVPTNLVYDVRAFRAREVTLALVGPFGLRDTLGEFIQATAYVDKLQFVSEVSPLTAKRSDNRIELNWSSSPNDYVLESTDSLSMTQLWQRVPVAPIIDREQHVVTVSPGGESRFYRLNLNIE
jgi:hypothetical protein